jgi:hypothetical protein
VSQRVSAARAIHVREREPWRATYSTAPRASASRDFWVSPERYL